MSLQHRVPPALAGLLLAASLLVSHAASAQEALSGDGRGALEAVSKFLDAQAHFDVPALRALTADQFVEISPLGEVDPRDKMIGFYVKDAPPGAPIPAIDERQVHVFGDSAIVTVRITININGQARSLRSNFVVHKEGTQWKLVSAQHTPMRPAKT
jgi:ketosteroid isomerase-like protein